MMRQIDSSEMSLREQPHIWSTHKGNKNIDLANCQLSEAVTEFIGGQFDEKVQAFQARAECDHNTMITGEKCRRD
jgi:hypothetical protein